MDDRFERITLSPEGTAEPDRFERVGTEADAPSPDRFERITAQPQPEDPWYTGMAEWADTSGLKSAGETLAKNFMDNLIMPVGEGVTAAAKNPIAIAEGVTEFAQQIPGFIGGLAGGIGRVVTELGKGDTNINSLYAKFHETMQEAAKGITDYVRFYEPQDKESVDKLLKMAFLVVEDITEGMLQVSDSPELKYLMDKSGLPDTYQEQFKGVLKFTGFILGMLAQGKVMHAGRKGVEATGAGTLAEAPKLDTTWAKDQIARRIEQEWDNPQRPLAKVAAEERRMAAQRPEPAETYDWARAQRYAQLVDAFRERRQTVAGPGGETGFVEQRSPGTMRLPTDRRTNGVPVFATTNEAVAFGERAAPEQIARMQTMLEDSRADSDILRNHAKIVEDPVERMQVMQMGRDEATRGQFLQEALEASKGEHPSQVKMRSAKDMLKDVNTALGKKGAVGDVGDMSPDQIAAYERLTKDYLVIRRNAKRLGKSVTDYLTGIRVDPAVAAAVERNADALLTHATTLYGADILKRYEEAATQEPREGKYAGSVNLDKQDIGRAGKQLEMAMAAEHPKRTISLAETRARAMEMAKTPKQVENTIKQLDKLTDGEFTAAGLMLREVETAYADQWGTAFDKFEKGEMSLQELYAESANMREDIFRTESDLASEAGRYLRMRRDVVSGMDIPTMMRELLGHKKELSPRQKEVIHQATKKWNDGTLTREDLANFKRMLPDPIWADYLKQIWYNNVLSGPVTHGKNLAGNTVWITTQPALRALSGMVDPLFTTLWGKERTRYASEVIPMLMGFRRGWTKGALRAKDMFRKGYVPSDMTKWEMEMGSAATAFERSPHKVLRTMAPAFTQFTRAMYAADVWAKAIAFDGEMAALAHRAALKQKGLKGLERQAWEQKYIENPPAMAMEEAKRFADASTFMDVPDPGTQSLIQMRNYGLAGDFVRYFLLPFVNTIGNLTKRGLELTPGVGVGKELLSYSAREAIRKSGRGGGYAQKWAKERTYNPSDITAKQIVGTALFTYMLHKASQGRLTGALPEDPAERSFWYENGIEPWSIRLGGTDVPAGVYGVQAGNGKWYSYRWVEPFNTPIAASASLYERVLRGDRDPKDIAQWLEFGGDMMNNIIDGAYFSGLQRLLDKNVPVKTRLEKSLPRFAASWVPYSGFMRTIARTYEAAKEGGVKVREGDPWIEAFAQVIPGLYGEVPAKLTVYGEEAVRPGGVLQQWLPVKWTEPRLDDVDQALALVGFYPSLPRDTVTFGNKTYKVPQDIYRDYCIDYGSRLRETFERLVDRNDFYRKTKEQQYDLFENKRVLAGNTARRNLLSHMRRYGLFTPDNEVEPRR